MNLKKKAAKGVLWASIQNWGSQVVSLAIFFVLARILRPEDFGLIALANVFLAFMQIFMSEGFAKALIQRQQIEREHLDTVFWLNLGVSLLLSGMTILAAGQVAVFFGEPGLTPILQSLSVLLIITSFSTVQQALLKRDFAFRVITMRSLFALALSGVIGVGMAIMGFGVWSLVSQQIVFELVAAMVLWYLSDWRPGFHVSLKHLKELWNFGIMTTGFDVLTFFHTRFDDVLIGYYLNAAALGFYSLAYRVLTIMTNLLVKTTSQVALPAFSRLQDDLDQLRRSYYSATQLTSFIAFPAFLGVVVLAQELVVVLFGDQWLPAVPALQILSLAGVMRSVTFFKSSILIAMNKPHWRLYLGLADTTLNVIGFMIAVRWGFTAVALAYTIRFYVMFPVGQWVVGHLIRAPFMTYLGQFVAPLLSATLMVIAMIIARVYLLNVLSPLGVLMVCSAIGAVVYFVAIALFAPKLFAKVHEVARLALERS